LGFFGEGEGAIVDSGEIEIIQDSRDIVFFARGFIGRYDWFWGEAVLLLGDVSWN
jgi:hypothetical protein